MNLKSGILLVAGVLLAAESSQAQRAHGGAASSAPAGPRRNALPYTVPRAVARPPASNLGGRPFVYRGSVAPPTGLIAPAASYTGIAPGALRTTENRRRFNNFSLGYGGFFGVPYVPYLDSGGAYSSYSGYPSYSEQAEGVSAQSDFQMQQEATAQQLDQMNAEIAYLRDNQLQPSPGPYAPPSPPAPAVAEQQVPQAPITLVLQSGGKVSVANYAVMNGVIWDFSKQPAHKIPLSAINVAASQKATEDSGGDFPQLPASH